MIRTIIAASLLAAAAPAAVAAQPEAEAQDSSLLWTAEGLAANVRPTLPQRFSGGETLTSAVAEGRLLILTYDVPGRMARRRSPDDLARRFARPFCAALGSQFFGAGNSLRIDVRVGNAAPQPATVMTACPDYSSD